MTKTYSTQQKTGLGVTIPPELKRAVRVAAAQAGMSTSEWVAWHLCQALDLPVSRFGITAPTSAVISDN